MKCNVAHGLCPSFSDRADGNCHDKVSEQLIEICVYRKIINKLEEAYHSDSNRLISSTRLHEMWERTVENASDT